MHICLQQQEPRGALVCQQGHGMGKRYGTGQEKYSQRRYVGDKDYIDDVNWVAYQVRQYCPPTSQFKCALHKN